MKLFQGYLNISLSRSLHAYASGISALLVLCLLGPLEIEVGPVDLSLQTLIMMIIGLVFRPLPSFIIVAIYLVLGAIGMPVFSGYSGGYEHLVGFTGGFLFFFPVFASMFSLATERFADSSLLTAFASLGVQLILLIVGFGYISMAGEMSFKDIGINIRGLIPGLLLKSLLIFFFHYFLIRFHRLTKSGS